MSIPEERYVDITRPGSSTGGVPAEIRELQRRLDAHIGKGGNAHAIATSEEAGFMSQSDKEKLDTVQNGATQNQTDEYLLNLANATGELPIEQVEGLQEEIDRISGDSAAQLREDLANDVAGDLGAHLIAYPSPEGESWKVADLANPDKGAAMVGFTPAGDMAQALNLATVLSLSTVDLLTRIPVSQWAGIAEGSSSFDCMPALAACLSTGRRVTVSMPGRYKFITPYAGTTDFDVEAICDGVEFDLSEVAAPSAISNSGEFVQIEDIGLPVSKGSAQVTFASPPSLSPGDWFCVFNPSDFSYSGFRANYKAGEWKQVLRIDGATVHTTQAFYDGYSPGDVDIYRMESVKSRLSNIHLVGGATPDNLVMFARCVNPVFDRITFEHANNSALRLNKTVGALINLPKGRNTGDGGDDYGISVSNTQHTRILGGDVYGRRHAVATGGDADICCVPVRDFRCIGTTLRNDPQQSVGASDMHGNVEDSSYEDCNIYGGANISGGGENYYINCRIHGPQELGWVGSYRELLGGRSGFIDCKFYAYANPQPFSRGLIDCGGNTTSMDDRTTREVTFVLRNNYLNGINLGPTTSFFLFRNRGSSVPVNLELEGLTLDVNDMGTLAILSAVSGVVAGSRLIVTGVSGLPSDRFLLRPGDYSGVPMRIQRQTGVIPGVTTNNNYVYSPNHYYRWQYPKPAAVMVTVQGRDGTPTDVIGGQPASSHVRASLADRVRFALRSADVMTAGEEFDFVWSAEINEC